MAIDQRDWYVDKLRKKTGYVERSSFRESMADIGRRKLRAAWFRSVFVLALFGALLLALLYVMRHR